MNEHLAYEIWRDAMNGELKPAALKTISGLHVPQECYGSTFTFVSVLFLVIYLVALYFPEGTVYIVKRLLGVKDEPEPTREAVTTTNNYYAGRQQHPIDPNDHLQQKEEQQRKYRRELTTRITNQYKTFVPVVLNIMGMTKIKSPERVTRIYDAIEELLSREAVIGYNWDKKIPRNIAILLDKLFPTGVKSDPENDDDESDDEYTRRIKTEPTDPLEVG